MITAIPMSSNRVSNHFKKAPQFIFLNEQGRFVGQIVNPAHPSMSDSCSGAATLMDEFERRNVSRVVVRNIGQRMLAKLLERQYSVFKTPTAQVELAKLAQGQSAELVSLTDAQQGRPSTKHEVKQAEGGCCGDTESAKACCHTDGGLNAKAKAMSCCSKSKRRCH